MTASFIIDQVSWHTSVCGNRESREHIEARFRAVFQFLSSHGLLKPGVRLPDPHGQLPESFCLLSDDLTEIGNAVMKAGYDRWLRAVDKGTLPSKVTILESSLSKVRSGYAQPTLQADGSASGGSAP